MKNSIIRDLTKNARIIISKIVFRIKIKYAKPKFLLFFLLVSLLFTIHFISGKKNKYNTTDDSAFFGGDTWEYQSLAVNLLHGHGYRFGGIEPLQVYKFDFNSGYTSRFKHFFDTETHYSFYRTPGYPFFLKIIYKIHGIHPAVVKKYQFIIIVIIASLMPLLCYYYYGYLGVLSGTISSFLFIKYFFSDFRTGTLLTEPLMLLSIFVWVIALIFWEKNPSNYRIFIFGIISGLLLLVKGSTIFLPFIFILFYLFYYRLSEKKKSLQILFYVFAVLLTIIPWSAYASLKSNNLILLSTQGDTMIADCNNKQAALTGNWSTNWPTNETNLKYILFERPHGSTKNNVLTAYNFYRENISMIILSIKNKIIFAMQYRPTKFCFILFLFYMFHSFITNRFKSYYRPNSIPAFAVIIFINLMLLTLVFYGSRRMLVPFMYFLLIPSVHFLFLIPIYINNMLEKSNLNDSI